MLCLLIGSSIIFVTLVQTFRWLFGKRSVANLAERAVLISGCDTGFGNELAKKCAKNQICTYAGCYTMGGYEALKEFANSNGIADRLRPVKLDVTDAKSIQACLDYVTAELEGKQGLWGLVNNAGIAVSTIDDWCFVEDYVRSLEVNALGMIRMCHAFKPLVKKAHGRIVNITSVFGRMTCGGQGPYCVSKFAAEAYCDVLRHEMVTWGVTVHILEPAFFTTAMSSAEANRAFFKRRWMELPQSIRDDYGEAFFGQILESLKKGLEAFSSPHTYQVVDAYYHALTSRRPRKRYYPGWPASLVLRYYMLMPEWVQDSCTRLLEKSVNMCPPAAIASQLDVDKKGQ